MMTDEEFDSVYTKGFNNGLEVMANTLKGLGREILEGSDNKYVPVEMIGMALEEMKQNG